MKSLREYRKSKDMTQKDLAAKVNISMPYYSLIETGRRVPSLRKSKKIADALDINLNQLYDLLFKTNNWSD